MEILKTVNTLTADDKYSLLNRGNLMQHIQMQLSHKQKHFSKLFICTSGHGICTNLRIIICKLIIHIKFLKSKAKTSWK